MGTNIRVGGQWITLESNIVDPPSGVSGSWRNTNNTHNVFYTNITSSVMYVSAIFHVKLLSADSGTEVIAGSSAWAYVSTSGETGTNLSNNYTNVCRVRDNGTANASDLYLNARFFVPSNCRYIVKLYNTSLSNTLGSRVSTLSWKEFDFELKSSDTTFNSKGSNSNNFSRAAKVSSSQITSTWSQFMKDYAVWYEPGNTGTNPPYSTTYTINITKAGDYTLEYGIDGNGNITFDGTQVASAVGTDASWTNDPPSFVTLSNVSTGTHTLVATVDGSTNWNSNPAGIAWKLKLSGT